MESKKMPCLTVLHPKQLTRRSTRGSSVKTSANSGEGPLPKASEQIAEDVRRGIALGELGEGDALPNESQLMEMYNASRPTVRAALRIMESASLISVKLGPGGGARVRNPDLGVIARQAALHLQLSRTTLRDLFDARAVLEPAAARRLAEQRPKKGVKLLRGLYEAELAVLDDPIAYPAAAAEFHEAIIELAGNNTLTLVGRLIHEMVAAHNRETVARTHSPARVAQRGSDSHARLLALIEDGKADEAEEYWREHLADGARLALAALGAHTVVNLFDDGWAPRVRRPSRPQAKPTT